MLCRRPPAAHSPRQQAAAAFQWTSLIGSRSSFVKRAVVARSTLNDSAEGKLLKAVEEVVASREALSEMKRIRRHVSALDKAATTNAEKAERFETKLEDLARVVSTSSSAGIAAKIEHLEAVIQANAAAASAEAKIQRLQRALIITHSDYDTAFDSIGTNTVIAILGAFLQGRGYLVSDCSWRCGSSDDDDEPEELRSMLEQQSVVGMCLEMSEVIHQLTGTKPRFEELDNGSHSELYIYYK